MFSIFFNQNMCFTCSADTKSVEKDFSLQALWNTKRKIFKLTIILQQLPVSSLWKISVLTFFCTFLIDWLESKMWLRHAIYYS